MRTRLGLFCDKVIEAGLLAAVAAVPVFFNVFSERSFEPDKAALLRSLVLLMAIAWLIGAIESRGLRRPPTLRQAQDIAADGRPPRLASLVTADPSTGSGHRRRRPTAVSHTVIVRRPSSVVRHLSSVVCRLSFSLLPLLLAVVYCMTTIVSVAPGLSLWGSYQRAQGLYTLLAYIGVFLLATQFLRTREQVNRLVTATLLTSVPVSLYAWAQQFGLDPQGWGGPQAGRVFSTLGNPIFLGGYLITVIPLTVARIWTAVTVLRRRGEKNQAGAVQASAYSALLLLQLASLVFSQSRGPLVGLLGSVFLMLLLMAAVRRERRLALGFLLAGATLGGLLILLTVPTTSLQGLRDLPFLGRYSRLLDPQSGTAQQRILTWQGTVDLIASDPARALVGYGPDTLIVTFNRHFPPELVPLLQQVTITFDRAHNATLDILATTGILGLLVFLSFVGATVYCGLEGLGLLAGSTQRRAFVAAVSIGGLLGALVPRLMDGSWRLAGLGLSAGWLLGVIAYLVGYIFAVDRPREAQTGQSVLLIALLTAMMGHFIEIQFGIAVVPTTLHFWLFAAMTWSLVRGTWQEPTDSRRRRRPQQRRTETRFLQGHFWGPGGWWAWMGWDPVRAPESLLIGLLLATLSFGLMTDPVLLHGHGMLLIGMLVMVSLICHALLSAHISTSPDSLGRPAETVSPAGDGSTPSVVGNAVLSLSWGLVFLIAHVLGIALGDDGTGSLTVYYAYVLLTVVAMASSLLRGQPRPEQSWRRRAVPLYIGLVLVAVWLAMVGNLNVVKADIHYKQALAYGEAGRWDESINQFEQAIHLAPHQDFYAILLAGAYVQKALAATTIGQRDAWMGKAEASLTRGWQRNPLYPDHSTKLGLLYRIWGEMSSDPAVQRQRLTQAEKRYEEAADLSPYSIPVLNGWAMVHIALGNYDRAEAILQRSLSLRPSVVETYLLLGDTHLAAGRVDDAAAAYAQAIALDSAAALSFKRSAVQSYPSDPTRHLQLALVYRELGQEESALREAQTAQRLAGGELPALAEVLDSLEKE